MRIGGPSIPNSQALTPLTRRARQSDSAPQQSFSVEDQKSDDSKGTVKSAKGEVRFRSATPFPGVSGRGQRAIQAYTQLDMLEQRAQYETLMGIDVYV